MLLALSFPSQLKPAFSSLPSRTSSLVFLHFSDVACHFRPSTHSFSSVRLTRPIALKRPVPCYLVDERQTGMGSALGFSPSARRILPGICSRCCHPLAGTFAPTFRTPGYISVTQALPTATRPSSALSALGLPLPTAPSRGGGIEFNRTFPHPGHSLTRDSYRSNGLAVPQVSDSASPTGMGCWHSSAFGPSALPTPRPPVPGVGPIFHGGRLFTGAEPLHPSWGGEGLPGWRDGGSSGFPLSPLPFTSQILLVSVVFVTMFS